MARITRIDTVRLLESFVGSNMLRIEEFRDGWPALGRILVGQVWTPVALHVGGIHSTHRDRDTIERRFQNPGQNKPVTAPPGYQPLLIGVHHALNSVDCLVGMDPYRRLGQRTRFSLFVPVTK